MSNLGQTIQIPPFRPIQDFIGGNEWSKPTFNPSEFGELQKQVISNLIYYQTNYGAFAIPLILLVAFFCPTAIIFGLVVVTALVGGFVYSTRQNIPALAPLKDRPIAILLLVLVVAFLVIRMFGTIFAFLFGIALPLLLIVVHATARKPSLQNKAENLSLEATPMGLLLTWLGAKANEQQPTTPQPKRK